MSSLIRKSIPDLLTRGHSILPAFAFLHMASPRPEPGQAFAPSSSALGHPEEAPSCPDLPMPQAMPWLRAVASRRPGDRLLCSGKRRVLNAMQLDYSANYSSLQVYFHLESLN